MNSGGSASINDLMWLRNIDAIGLPYLKVEFNPIDYDVAPWIGYDWDMHAGDPLRHGCVGVGWNVISWVNRSDGTIYILASWEMFHDLGDNASGVAF
jgi:hypothetical protein